jgi:tight adherence protein C
MVILLILAVLLVGVAVALVVASVFEPRARRSENLAGIEAYGYAGRLTSETKAARKKGRSLDDLATKVGDVVGRRVVRLRELDVQRELVAAGFFNVSARRFLGYRVLLAIALPLLFIWLLSLAGSSVGVIFLVALIAFVVGWMGPNYYVHRRARLRLRKVDDALPAMIDLLVVTLEAGIAFTGALRMAAERLTGPLGEEIRLTIQEQSLGLSMLESLENWHRRCDTPAVRSFVRAMVQGDRLGVSIGAILRNQAIEMRARQRHTVEERAQKAPIKILFPLVFLIFPAMFVVILGPAVFAILKNLK